MGDGGPACEQSAQSAGAARPRGPSTIPVCTPLRPEERAWISRIFDELGWVDVYRRLHPEATGESYTWWSNRGQAWAKNVGWRIDYQIATPKTAARARCCEVYKTRRFSDHAPLIVEYTGRL